MMFYYWHSYQIYETCGFPDWIISDRFDDAQYFQAAWLALTRKGYLENLAYWYGEKVSPSWPQGRRVRKSRLFVWR